MKDCEIIFDYIIYHKGCFDGYGAFVSLLLSKRTTKNPYVFPDYPGQKNLPPNIKNKNVIIMDVAYTPEVVKKISEVANIVYFIDHHVTIAKDIVNLKLKEPNKVIYDVNKSGASLVWDMFHPNKDRPLIINLIEDNDLGRWKDERTHWLYSLFDVEYDTEANNDSFNKMKVLFDNDNLLPKLVEGRYYYKYKKYLIDKNASRYSVAMFPSKKLVSEGYFKKKHQYKVAVTDSVCPSISLVGKAINNNTKLDFTALYYFRPFKDVTVVSLRSNGTDIGSIAKTMGGGGHKQAAAFSYKGKITDIFDFI